MEKDRIEMSQRERDVLKVMSLVLSGKRTQLEAARLLGRSVRQVRRIQDRLKSQGDAGVVHRLRGKRSNNASDPKVIAKVLSLCRGVYGGFGPTLIGEKLAEDHGVEMSRESLRRLLLAEGLWQRQRHRYRHRSRRERRACFGEMVQADASEHDWLEGRGPMLTLVGMIDDATDRVVLRFYPSETTEAYMDTLRRWIQKHGRPASWYSDRHGIFRAEEKVAGYDQKQSVLTQFSRGLKELNIELILAGSPQAKGRVERLWGTAQDRLVKELRLAKAKTIEQANAVLDSKFTPWFNRRCTHKAASGNDAHRPLGNSLDLDAILSIQHERVVANDYTIRIDNRVYQLLPPAWPGLRKGKVIVERRADGSMRVRFKRRYLKFQEVKDAVAAAGMPGALPPDPRSLARKPIPAGVGEREDRIESTRPPAVHRPAGRSGRTPALPYPADGKSCGTSKAAYRPPPTHPWRQKACA
jgi:transposase